MKLIVLFKHDLGLDFMFLDHNLKLLDTFLLFGHDLEFLFQVICLAFVIKFSPLLLFE